MHLGPYQRYGSVGERRLEPTPVPTTAAASARPCTVSVTSHRPRGSPAGSTIEKLRSLASPMTPAWLCPGTSGSGGAHRIPSVPLLGGVDYDSAVTIQHAESGRSEGQACMDPVGPLRKINLIRQRYRGLRSCARRPTRRLPPELTNGMYVAVMSLRLLGRDGPWSYQLKGSVYAGRNVRKYQ
jgi:hypothetical protein